MKEQDIIERLIEVIDLNAIAPIYDPTMDTEKGAEVRKLLSDISGLPLDEALLEVGKINRALKGKFPAEAE
ncbi:MAG: hypothetical protein N5P05_004405 (plasmid) [Chroococcopsis gigantea SAG 12.99]|jgi:hypothetical protein|nr:hypothetical protein [Chroococcopsis gigantea SAG 12.99]